MGAVRTPTRRTAKQQQYRLDFDREEAEEVIVFSTPTTFYRKGNLISTRPQGRLTPPPPRQYAPTPGVGVRRRYRDVVTSEEFTWRF